MKMIIFLKHLFIPHHGNEYKPHYFREVAVASLLFVSVFLLGASFGSSLFIHKSVLGQSIASSVLVDLTNESRTAEGLPPLIKNNLLEQGAMLKGEDMASKEYFAHTAPDGTEPWHWFNEAGYSFLYAGENLAVNFTDAEDVTNAWMNSKSHRANIENTHFKEIGIATVPGYYNNYETTYIVQFFGTRGVAPPHSEVVITEESTSTKSESKKLGSKSMSPSSLVTKEDASGNTSTTSPATSSPIVVTAITPDAVSAVDTSHHEGSVSGASTVNGTYATWYERILFFLSSYIDIIYKTLIVITAVALLLMISIEVRKQHVLHISLGVGLLFILSLFVYINQGFF